MLHSPPSLWNKSMPSKSSKFTPAYVVVRSRAEKKNPSFVSNVERRMCIFIHIMRKWPNEATAGSVE